ncbi:MAG: 50S ribosomal protein L4 [Candidatus Omnitrophica bacterium]|nr:50S ribosomal protein L4 [Candidatus Omnitrophota bacterium]
MPSIELHNLEGKVVGELSLPAALEGPVSQDILWQAVRMYLANQREGNADTKTRGEVRGGGKKPWRQKHTGQARHGTIRSPIWRKGGIVFGPHPREYRYSLPAAIRRKALVNSLRVKVSEKAMLAVESFEGLEPKTKSLAQLLKKLRVSGGALLVVDQPNTQLARIARNIPLVSVKPARDLNCYDVLAHPRLVLSAQGLKELEGVVA